MNEPRKIFIRTDDPALQSLLREGLARHGLAEAVTFDPPADGHDLAAIDVPGAEKLRLGGLIDRVRELRRCAPRITWPQDAVFAIGPWRFEPEHAALKNKSGETTRLTEKERDILAFLCLRADQRTDRTTLLRAVWGYGPDIETHTVETHIYRLRQKMERDPAKPDYLLTQEDGYRLIQTPQ